MDANEPPVDMDAPMTAEEWAIWNALWSIPEFRRHHGVYHLGPLSQKEIIEITGFSRRIVQYLEIKALRKIKRPITKYLKDEI